MHKTVENIMQMKQNQEKISVITSYDYTLASLCDRAGIDVILVGDSAGMVMLGYENTVQVTMEHMCMFTNAVSKARRDALVVADLPFMSYQASVENAISNAGKLIKAGADAVKLEGGKEMAKTVRAIADVGIPVMGHIGLQPQTTTLLQGYKVQGRTKEAALRLINDANELQKAGVFSIVLEMVSHEVAQIISETVSIPTIGIGSGVNCDGQVLVAQDLLGMYDRIKPKFVNRYMNLSEDITKSLANYKNDVRAGVFPSEENWFGMNKEELQRLRDYLG